MPDPATVTRTDVLVAGGGAAALETLLALHERLAGARDITLLAPDVRFRYRPLAAYVGLVPDLRASVDLAAMTDRHGAGFVRDRLAYVHANESQVQTRHGGRIAYEALVVAIGAVAVGPIPGAVTLGYPHEEQAFGALVQRVRAGDVERLAIVVPPNLRWTLPAYETALLLRHASPHPSMKIAVTTPETAPLEEFGPEIGAAVAGLLGERDIELYPEAFPETLADGQLWMPWHGTVAVDAVVALARPVGPIVSGLPIDPLGFIPVDETGRVVGTTGIWAVGDAAAHATKQGGFALQQAGAAADDIADTLSRARAGERAADSPARPLVMRAALLDGERTLYLKAERQEDGWHGTASREPLWSPPTKIAGGRLTTYLAEQESAEG